MATLMGVVSKVVGEVFAVAADGSRRPLGQGDKVFVGEQLVTGANGAVALKIAGGGEITLGRDSSLPMTPQLQAAAHHLDGGDQAVAQQPVAPSQKDVTDVKALQAAIAAGADPTQAAEATAAGPSAGAAANGKPGGGHSFVLLTETAGHVSPDIGFPTGPIGGGPLFPHHEVAAPFERAATEAPVTPPPEVPPPTEPPVDGRPSAGPGAVDIFEDSLPGAVPDGHSSTLAGNLSYSFGPDGVGGFSWSTAGLPNLTSGGVPLTYSLSADGHVLTASANGSPVFTLTLTNINTGAYELTLLQPVDHPVKGVEDTRNFGVGFTVTDGNGTTAGSTLTVGIVDDAPRAGLSASNEVDVLLHTHDADTIGSAFDTSTADYSSAFQVSAGYGADGAGSTVLTYSLKLVGADGTDSGLTSGDSPIYLYSVGGVIVASTSASAAGITSENTIFSLSVNSGSGVVTLTQYGAIDHQLPGSTSNYASQNAVLDSGLVKLQGDLVVTDRDGDSASSSSSIDLGGRVSFSDDGPEIHPSPEADIKLQVDETKLGVDARIDDVSTLFNAHFGADGAGKIEYQISTTNGTDSGLTDTATGHRILLFNDGNGGVVGRVEGTSFTAFTLTLSGGVITLDQQRALVHPVTTNPNDPLSIDDGKITLTATITDKDGDSDSAQIDLGSKLTFLDDGPCIKPCTEADIKLQVDETKLGVDARIDDVSTLFNAHFGADGAGKIEYQISTTNGTDSGLTDTATGHRILLFNDGNGGVVGRVEGTSFTAFTLTLSGGVITLDQQRALVHPITTNPNDPLSIDDGKITLTATITDKDGDSDSAQIDLGSKLTFLDDGPCIKPCTEADIRLEVDESTLNSDARVEADEVAKLFTAHFGADGPGNITLQVRTVDGTDSGVRESATGHRILLFNYGNGVVGRVEGSGEIAFEVKPNGGALELDQRLALVHSNSNDPDDTLSLDKGKISLVATITDKDGDSDSAQVDLGSKLVFYDDGPTISLAGNFSGHLIVDETHLGDDATANFSTAFKVNTGADGGGVTYSLSSAANGTLTGLQTTAGQNIVLFKVSDTQIEGRVGNINGATAFTLTLNSSTGDLTLDQQLALKHPNGSDPNDALHLADNKISLNATVTDGDLDSRSISLDLGGKLTFRDDGPTAVDDSPRCLVQQAPPAVNLTLVVDISGSMAGNKLVNAKAALVSMLQQYAAMGIAIHVSLVTFESSASDKGDFNFSSASDSQFTSLVNTINGLSAGGNTNYEAALNLAKSNVTADITAPGHDPAAINRVYFISDGEPTVGNTNTAITQWKAFLANPDGDGNDSTNHVDAFAVGLGTSITDADLVGIDSKGTPIIVSQPSDLSATLQSLVTVDSVSGNLLANDLPVSADGTVRITQVEFGGEKFAVDTNGVLTNVNPNATTATATYNSTTGLLTVQTANGTLTVYLKDVAGHQAGDYTYASKAGAQFPESGQISEVFKYTIIDGDGDTASANLNICLKYGQSILVVGSNSGDVDGSSVPHTVPSPLDTDKAGQINGAGGNDVLIGDAGGVSVYTQPGKNYNISLIVDTSGSMADPSGSGMSRMELAKQALTNLVNQIKGHDGVINISLVSFSDSSHIATYNGLSAANVTALLAAINALGAGGGTNYEAAMKDANGWFKTQVSGSADAAHGYVNLAFFLTDGNPTVYTGDNGNTGTVTNYNDINNALVAGNDMLHHAGTLSGANEVDVNAIGIGNGINSNYLKFFDNTDSTGTGTLILDSKTISASVGEPQIINTAEQLQAALQEGFSTSTPVTVGNDHLVGGAGNDIIFGDVINTDQLAWAGHAAGSHNGQGYQALVDYLTATNGSAPTIAQVSNYIVQHAQDFNVAGDTRGGDDILEGGAGNDLMFGQGGNDKLIGGPGDDIMFGGTGADEFIWKSGDTGHDVIKDFSFTEGDTLNLADLLQGESESASSLAHYLTFSVSSGTTSIGVSPTSGGTVTQTIDLANVDLSAKYLGHAGNGVLSAGDTQTVLNGLLGDHAIKTDTV